MVLTATACAGGDAEPGAVATRTPTSELRDGMEPPQGLRPAVTASPEASRFRWLPLVDESSGTRVALPEGAKPIGNTVTGPDGAAITTRGFVFEHADGVIGFELIDDYASLDDLEKLADFLATSVGGAVVTTEEVDLGRERGADGEIVYGGDQVMLFRILVLNSDGDVWTGFVGGPEADRELLESEFARLTESANLRPAAGWVAVVDEPSDISVELPDAVPLEDLSIEGIPQRGYFHADGMGFLVIDVPPEENPLDEVLAGMALSIDAEVDSSQPADVPGYDAHDGVFTDQDGWVWAYRAIALDDRVLLLHAVDTAEKLPDSQAAVERMSESVVIP